MTIITGIPLAAVSSAIDGEVSAVMIKGGAVPTGCGMTFLTSGRKSGGRMIGIGCIIIIGSMTGDTLLGSITIAIAVAGGTLLLLMGTGQRETGIGMIKGSRFPGICRMARGTIVTEIIGLVIGIRDRIVIRAVTTPAVRRRIVIAIAVTGHAIQRGMGAGQREIGIGMIKSRRFPGGCRVTRGTIVAEIIGLVVGIADRVIIRTMAAPAIRGRIVIAIAMAIHAVYGGMSSRQRETGISVIKIDRLPGVCAVAGGTIMAEIICLMIGIADRVKLGLMASETITGQSRKLIIDMTVLATGPLMGAGKFKPGSFQMVKSAPLPVIGIMTLLAYRRKTESEVARIACPFIILTVAIITIGLGAAVSVGVTGDTFQIRMSARERKCLGMIKGGPFPARGVGQVALLAIQIKAGFLMGRLQRFHKIRQVASLTVHRCVAETMAGILVAMAGSAFQVGMHAHQREIGLIMFFQHVHAIFPSGGRMAAFTTDTQLILVYIGMTIDTGHAHPVKNQTLMTLTAGNILVLADQRITGQIMIKLIGIYRIKVTGRMAG